MRYRENKSGPAQREYFAAWVFFVFMTITVIAGLTLFYKDREVRKIINESAPQASMHFSHNIEISIGSYFDVLQDLISHELVVPTLEAQNITSAELSKSEIANMDNAWRNSLDGDELARGVLASELSMALQEFQLSYDEFSKILITDKYGLNVAMADKTTDFYHADEAGWIRAYNNGKGESYHGGVVYDESSRTEIIPLRIPIYGSDRTEVVGILMVGVGINGIQNLL